MRTATSARTRTLTEAAVAIALQIGIARWLARATERAEDREDVDLHVREAATR